MLNRIEVIGVVGINMAIKAGAGFEVTNSACEAHAVQCTPAPSKEYSDSELSNA